MIILFPTTSGAPTRDLLRSKPYYKIRTFTLTLLIFILGGFSNKKIVKTDAFLLSTTINPHVGVVSRQSLLAHALNPYGPVASIVSILDEKDSLNIRDDMKRSLQKAGFVDVKFQEDNEDCYFRYRLDRATGMLKLLSSPLLPPLLDSIDDSTNVQKISHRGFSAPRWIPLVNDVETVLVSNGWSFLDLDDNEPISPFDIDAANIEGLYRPKWGRQQQTNILLEGINDDTSRDDDDDKLVLSSLGFRLNRLSNSQIQRLANTEIHNALTRSVLLQGKTDPPHVKITHNNVSFRNMAVSSMTGIFTCALGGLPLFTTIDLSPITTASSGWLSFTRPIADDHIILVYPDTRNCFTGDETSINGHKLNDKSKYNKDGSYDIDHRIEVLCARTGCHLGHYFPSGNGDDKGNYCINASAMNFISSKGVDNDHDNNEVTYFSGPESWWLLAASKLEGSKESSSILLLNHVLQQQVVATQQTVLLGAGCFWHVESALRRLPGIIDTEVGYAGGNGAFTTTTVTTTPRQQQQQQQQRRPSYEDVCHDMTGHAEVVKVVFDPNILNPSILFDCFFALHDPTKVRAHGKHAARTGQYRSCIFVSHDDMAHVAQHALEECSTQLGHKELSTEIHCCLDQDDDFHDEYNNDDDKNDDDNSGNLKLFWKAEDYHQRHEERRLRAAAANENDIQAIVRNSLSTLSLQQWLSTYGRRRQSILGSSETIVSSATIATTPLTAL